MRFKHFTTILLCLFLLQPAPGWSQETDAASEVVAPAWVPPDIIDLPANWWQNFITENTEVLRIRADLLTASISEYIRSLDADNLVAGQSALNTLSTNLDTAITLQEVAVNSQFEALPTLDSYTLNQFLDLRKLWRVGDAQFQTLKMQQQQINRQSGLLQEVSDLTLTTYSNTDPGSPTRVLAGLRRVNIYIELYVLKKRLEIKTDQQKQLSRYLNEASQKIKYATGHLSPEGLSLSELESNIQSLNLEAAGFTSKLAVTQKKLLDAIKTDETDSTIILSLKQQLTEVSAEVLLTQLKAELAYSKRDWLLLRSGAASASRDLRRSKPVFKALLQEAVEQSALWGHASQTTLITPAPESNRKHRKIYAEAQTSAHTTLSLIVEINSMIDNLSLVQKQVTNETIKLKKGFGGGWLRITLFAQSLWSQSAALLNVSLFHFGDRPVTTGGITKALFIFMFFWVISWLIRFFLDRIERRQHFQQGSFYAGGRVLHYIILTVAGFAAFGSIGLDFSSFALIAGALSVGIGFGLQSVVLNFVSGLILLFEGSVRVGDYVELDDGGRDSRLMGSVKEIRSRATLINTNDNVDVIVPNSQLVGNRMINWTLRESTARMRIPFSVAYGSDKELVKKAALEAAAEGEFCIHHTPGRESAVRMISFGDNGLHFELRVWVNRQGVRRPIYVRSSILWVMDTKFREYGIEVPYPQRDLHIKDRSRLFDSEEPEEPELES